MKKCHWYIQSNLNSTESAKMVAALSQLEYPHTLFKLIPFSNNLPKLGATDPMILIGSTTLNILAAQSRKYKKGIFFNNNFKPEHYREHYGEDYLNFDMSVYKIKDIPEDLYPSDQNLFVRSNDDSKNISGGTLWFEDLLNIKKNTEAYWSGGDLFTPENEICISSVKNVYNEFRFIVCDKKIIGASQYRPTISPDVPELIKDYALTMAKKWQPHDVFVLDICDTDNGPRVIECNCVNGSGWYSMDYVSVCRELSAYQENRRK